MPETSDQKRMDRTMFLPTPSSTMASSSFMKRSGVDEMAVSVLGNQA